MQIDKCRLDRGSAERRPTRKIFAATLAIAKEEGYKVPDPSKSSVVKMIAAVSAAML
jgi:hypothetical protein